MIREIGTVPQEDLEAICRIFAGKEGVLFVGARHHDAGDDVLHGIDFCFSADIGARAFAIEFELGHDEDVEEIRNSIVKKTFEKITAIS